MLAALSRRRRSHRPGCVSSPLPQTIFCKLIQSRKIFCAVSTRMKTTWAYHLFLKQAAERDFVLPPSTAPCHPAPGRRLLIIRNDNQSPAASLFVGFDGILEPSSSAAAKGTTQPTAYKRQSSLVSLSKLDTADAFSPKLTADSPTTTSSKKRWTLLGKMIPSTLLTTIDGSSTSFHSRGPSSTKTLEEARRETALARSRPSLQRKSSSTDSETPLATATRHRAFSFKFSLEWSQHFDKAQSNGNGNGGGAGRWREGVPGFNAGHERWLCPPRLPAPAQSSLGARVPGASREVAPRDPAEKITSAKYAGRALAEWALIVSECNNFVDRRRNEGVPGLKWVEVPTLGVEGFRKFGA